MHLQLSKVQTVTSLFKVIGILHTQNDTDLQAIWNHPTACAQTLESPESLNTQLTHMTPTSLEPAKAQVLAMLRHTAYDHEATLEKARANKTLRFIAFTY